MTALLGHPVLLARELGLRLPLFLVVDTSLAIMRTVVLTHDNVLEQQAPKLGLKD